MRRGERKVGGKEINGGVEAREEVKNKRKERKVKRGEGRRGGMYGYNLYQQNLSIMCF